MALLFAELITPGSVVFEGEVRSVVLSGVEGDMTVLPGHAPVVTLLFPGMVFATDAEGKDAGLSCGAALSRSRGLCRSGFRPLWSRPGSRRFCWRRAT